MVHSPLRFNALIEGFSFHHIRFSRISLRHVDFFSLRNHLVHLGLSSDGGSTISPTSVQHVRLSCISSRASETIWFILDCLPTEDLLSLRATCQTFLHIITPRIFSNLHLCRSIHHQLKCLQSLSSPYCTISPYIISLKIISADIDCGRDMLKSFVYFPSAISRMCNLKTVQ
jgi:hypothetical protein